MASLDYLELYPGYGDLGSTECRAYSVIKSPYLSENSGGLDLLFKFLSRRHHQRNGSEWGGGGYKILGSVPRLLLKRHYYLKDWLYNIDM